jgi:pimeloyl-ACP methyl ester carboxylesterase
MLIITASLFGIAITLFIILEVLSPGTPKPYIDNAGKPEADSISEKIYVNINGVEQGMFIKGKNASNPVLLYLHGGMPDYFLTERYPTGLDDYFVVIWWEQRGSGLSFRSDISPETVNAQQLVSDTVELTQHLRQRFKKDKIYLMGHSGGTFIGIQAAARAPYLYHAYIAISQMSHQLASEQLAYNYMLQKFKDRGDMKMVRKLESAAATTSVPLSDAYLSVRAVALQSLGIGTTNDIKSIANGRLLRSFLNREYTLKEKINLWRGGFFSGRQLWHTQLSTDLPRSVKRLELPVYFTVYTITPPPIRLPGHTTHSWTLR